MITINIKYLIKNVSVNSTKDGNLIAEEVSNTINQALKSVITSAQETLKSGTTENELKSSVQKVQD